MSVLERGILLSKRRRKISDTNEEEVLKVLKLMRTRTYIGLDGINVDDLKH